MNTVTYERNTDTTDLDARFDPIIKQQACYYNMTVKQFSKSMGDLADAVNECLDVFIDLIIEIKGKQPNNVMDMLVKKSKETK